MCTEEDVKLFDREMTYHEDDLGGSRGTITVLWVGDDRYAGWSRCHSDMDQFNRKLGRKIALGRALHALKEDKALIPVRRFDEDKECFENCYQKIDVSEPSIEVCFSEYEDTVMYRLPDFMYRQVKRVKKES